MPHRNDGVGLDVVLHRRELAVAVLRHLLRRLGLHLARRKDVLVPAPFALHRRRCLRAEHLLHRARHDAGHVGVAADVVVRGGVPQDFRDCLAVARDAVLHVHLGRASLA